MAYYLLFDSECLPCSSLARAIENESRGWLVARSLRDEEMQALLKLARPRWKWEPTLLEVQGKRVRVFTGLALRGKLLLGLGPRGAWRVAHLIVQSGRPSTRSAVETGRRDVLKLGSNVAGLLAVGLGLGLPDLTTRATLGQKEQAASEKVLLAPDHPAIAMLKASRVVRRASRHFGPPAWDQVYQMTHQATGEVGYLLAHQSSEPLNVPESRFMLVMHPEDPNRAQGIVGRIVPGEGHSHAIHWHLPNALSLGTSTFDGVQFTTSFNEAAHPKRRRGKRFIAKDATIDSAAACFVSCLTVLGGTVGPACEADCVACLAAPETLILCVGCALCVGGPLFECWVYCQQNNSGVTPTTNVIYSYSYIGYSGSDSSGPGPKRV